MRRRRLPAVLLSSALVIGALQAPAAAAPSTTTGTPTATEKSTSVTLITGDRITTLGKGASIQPGPGRAKIRFLTRTDGEHRYVIPSDALALLRAGRLDKRLFDVTELAAQGGGDLRLLISYPKNSASGARSALTAGGAQVTRDIPQVGVFAARADRGSIWSSLTSGPADARSLTAGVQRVWLDVLASAEKIGAASPFAVLGLSEVAGIVTDVPSDHPELARLRETGVPILADPR